jgi:hypothetical protein
VAPLPSTYQFQLNFPLFLRPKEEKTEQNDYSRQRKGGRRVVGGETEGGVERGEAEEEEGRKPQW